jgi:hypothetical protein
MCNVTKSCPNLISVPTPKLIHNFSILNFMVFDCQKFTCFITLSAALAAAGFMNGPQVGDANIEVTS